MQGSVRAGECACTGVCVESTCQAQKALVRGSNRHLVEAAWRAADGPDETRRLETLHAFDQVCRVEVGLPNPRKHLLLLVAIGTALAVGVLGGGGGGGCACAVGGKGSERGIGARHWFEGRFAAGVRVRACTSRACGCASGERGCASRACGCASRACGCASGERGCARARLPDDPAGVGHVDGRLGDARLVHQQRCGADARRAGPVE